MIKLLAPNVVCLSTVEVVICDEFEKVIMRLLCVFMMCCFLQACEASDYYFFVEGEKEVTSSTLYKNDHLTISFQVYNGNISRLNLSSSKENKDLDIEILRYENSLLVNETLYTPSLIGDYGLGVINFPENGWVTITSKLVLDEKPKSLIESVVIEMLIEGDLVTISKEFHLIMGSYSRFEALMD